MRILLVEDDGFHQVMMREALRKRWPDCDIRVAGTRADALECARSETYDAYILDLVLPDGDSMDVLRSLRSEGVVGPVLMVTGQGDELVAVHAMKEGVSDYIIKKGDYWELLPRSLEESLRGPARGPVTPAEAGAQRPPARDDARREALLEEELNEERSLRWRLEKQLRHRTEFVANVSHDLRTPLTAVKNALEILHTDLAPGLSREARRFVDIGSRGAERLAQILDDLLDMSRLEAGRFDLNLQPVDVDRLCRDLIERLQPEIAQTHVDVTYARTATSHVAYADPARVLQVMQSLLMLALRNSPPWSLVRVSLEDAPAEEDEAAAAQGISKSLCVRVTDAAPPLSSEERETLFDSYGAGQDPQDARRHGGGPGLPLARELVLAHSGRIWAESTQSGNQVAFTLPVHSEETVLLLEFESEKKKARRQFCCVSLIAFRLRDAATVFGSATPGPDHPAVGKLVEVIRSHIRRGTGKALWWRGPVPAIAVLASADRAGARALARRLETTLCSLGSAGLGLHRPVVIEYGISVYPVEQLDGPDLIAAAMQDKEKEFPLS